MRHRNEIERSIIGAVLSSSGCFDRVRGFLNKNSFKDTFHKEVWTCFGLLHEQQQQITMKGVKYTILRHRQTDSVLPSDLAAARAIAVQLANTAIASTAGDVVNIEHNALLLVEFGIADRFLDICQMVKPEHGALHYAATQSIEDIRLYTLRSADVLEVSVAEWTKIDAAHDATIELKALYSDVCAKAAKIKSAQRARTVTAKDPMPQSRYQSPYENRKFAVGVVDRKRDTPPMKKGFRKQVVDEIANSLLNGF